MTVRVAQGGLMIAVSPSAGGGGSAVDETTAAFEEFRQRASKFVVDGHTFYAVRLGQQGTWVYDLSTGQWAQWSTLGDDVWDNEYCHDWFDRVVGGDRAFPVIRTVTPNNGNDEDFLPIRRTVTGPVPWRRRDYIPVQAVRISASAGAPFEAGADFQLRWTDDAGNNYTSYMTIDLTVSDFDQDLSFRGLGSIRKPGRFFEVRDTGGVVRIDGAEIEHDGEQ